MQSCYGVNLTCSSLFNRHRSSGPTNWFSGCLSDLFEGDWSFGCYFRAAGRAKGIQIAAEGLVDLGVTVVASVNNDPNPFKTFFAACRRSPARSPKVIAVGASNENDWKAWFSQYGFCLDIFAPGTNIQGSWYFSDSSYRVESGTSFATAAVSGVAALYLQRDATMTPEEVKSAILNDASRGRWLGLFSPNRILSTVALKES